MKRYDIGFQQALRLTLTHMPAPRKEILPILQAAGRICAEPVYSMVDSPSVDASIKDGFAVFSRDLTTASETAPVRLALSGRVAAGECSARKVLPGNALRILSGAPIPDGADAVLAEEFARTEGDTVLALADASKGRNILPQGADVKSGEILADAGMVITPPLTSLLVAGGIAAVPVFTHPRVGLLATGSEVLLPGRILEKGKLFASNVALQEAWLRTKKLETNLLHAADDGGAIQTAVADLLSRSDVVVTSGGAWKGDRDLIVKVLAAMGAEQIFHRVRMGPGKAVGLAILDGKPVFCLPGGPTSNEMAFLMIALPGILKMAGHSRFPYLRLTGALETPVNGQADWTQFVQCRIILQEDRALLRPEKLKSRLTGMFRTQALVEIPEGVTTLSAGQAVPYWCLDRSVFSVSF
ncbi:MAG: molybdopterin molybdotransferase MoeA [Thermodesulfobacteriota bacterium]